jgi:hypothetical protein
MLNAMAKADAAKEAPGLAAIEAIRDLQKKSGYRTTADHNRAHAKFEALQRGQAAGSEGFNRLHPRSKLSAPVSRERDDARHDRIGPDLAEARRLLDAAGSLIAAARASGEATGIRAEFRMRRLR